MIGNTLTTAQHRSIIEVNLSKNYDELRNALQNFDYVIKSGEIIKKQDKFNLNPVGSIFWSKSTLEIKKKDFIINKKNDFFRKYSSVFYDSYKVSIDENHLRRIQ